MDYCQETRLARKRGSLDKVESIQETGGEPGDDEFAARGPEMGVRQSQGLAQGGFLLADSVKYVLPVRLRNLRGMFSWQFVQGAKLGMGPTSPHQ